MRNIRELGNVQRRATKLIPSIQNLPYPERSQNLNLPILSYRRYCVDLIMTYKILNKAMLLDKDYFLQGIPATLDLMD